MNVLANHLERASEAEPHEPLPVFDSVIGDILSFCPLDNLECKENILGIYRDACRVKLAIGSLGVCPRFVWGVDVVRCGFDGLPCNRFVDMRLVDCKDSKLGSPLRVVCSRFVGGRSVV